MFTTKKWDPISLGEMADVGWAKPQIKTIAKSIFYYRNRK